MKSMPLFISLLCGGVLLSSSALAKETKPEALPELTERGKTLEAAFANQTQSLKSEIEKQLPAIDQAKVAAWMAAITAEEGPANEVAVTAKAVAQLQKAEITVKQLEESAKKAPKTFAEAKEELAEILAKGESDPELEKLLASEDTFLAQIKKEQDQLRVKIEMAAAAAKDAQAALPEAIKAAEAAKQAHEKAMATTWKAMEALGMTAILSSDPLDGKLAQYMVIKTATPRGLAEFSEKSPENENLIKQLLADKDLMVQMLVADGPTAGKYGEAMKIYTEIQKASPKAKEGVFQRLALAVSLVHAVPICKQVPSADDDADVPNTTDSSVKDASQVIDPVKRYLSYEKWYLDGELDQGFKDLSVWNLTMVVNGEEPDEVLAWGRQMLRNLRPDCIPNDGDTSVYVDVVVKEISYGSGKVKEDRPELQFMQNILANGGICGRHAFFGRFILRAFGVPTAARKQPKHATLAHWHPDGWQTKLGGNWGKGPRGRYSTMNDSRTRPYGVDINFLASTQAREDATAFMRVKRAQWIDALVVEDAKPGLITDSGKAKGPANKKGAEIKKPVFWHDLALQEQRRIIAGLEAKTAPSKSTASVAARPVATGKITVDDKGVITIPSAACSSPTERTHVVGRNADRDMVVFVKDNKSGETRLHYSRHTTAADTFEYTFDVPKAGKYQMLASVVTPRWEQRLFVTANGGAAVEMPLPYTIGMWDKTAPVEIELAAGKNVLKFHGPARVTMKEFVLTPAK